MGYSPRGRKESDTTERLQFTFTRVFKTGHVSHVNWSESREITVS